MSASARASLLVLGTRGAGGSPGVRLGAVAPRLASQARCPVVFATMDGRPASHEIVVGTDGSYHAAALLEFGFGEADARNAKLTALHIWAHPQAGGLESYHDWMLSVGPTNETAAALLSEQVAPWRHKYPDVLVTESTVHGNPGRALVLASERADLIVIGARRGGLGLASALGPVADALLHHMQCAVAVIPGGE